MTIKKDQMVSVAYELRLDSKDGEIFETVTGENPLTFLYGTGMMIPAFENALKGKDINDNLDVYIPAIEAYGEVNPNAIVDIPVSVFEIDGAIQDGLLTVGNVIPMMSERGQALGTVREVSDTNVKMDFNHPAAGRDLYFTLQIIDAHDATPEELMAVPHACGCGTGDCDCNEESCECSK